MKTRANAPDARTPVGPTSNPFFTTQVTRAAYIPHGPNFEGCTRAPLGDLGSNAGLALKSARQVLSIQLEITDIHRKASVEFGNFHPSDTQCVPSRSSIIMGRKTSEDAPTNLSYLSKQSMLRHGRTRNIGIRRDSVGIRQSS